MLGLSPVVHPTDEETLELPSKLSLPVAIGDVASSQGKVPVVAPVPVAPTKLASDSVIGNTSRIAPDEAYSKDEELLNDFLKLHPMLSGLVNA